MLYNYEIFIIKCYYKYDISIVLFFFIDIRFMLLCNVKKNGVLIILRYNMIGKRGKGINIFFKS